MARRSAIDRGREAFARRRWREAYERLCAADRESSLGPADLERFAAAAYLVGEDARATAIWTRAHQQFIDRGEPERAARCGFWLSLNLLLKGEVGGGTGWLARSWRLLGDRDDACVEQGYGLVVTGLMEMGGGDVESAGARFEEAVALAERFADADLLALGLLGRGQCLVQSNRSADGVARLDEAMVAVATGDVSPVLAGLVYCAVILTCQRIFDLRRAREWTRQLDAWCASQPDLVPYRGQCLVHRSEILQWRGDWPGALAEARTAIAHLAETSGAVAGRACYQQGELHRLRGEYAEANEMYLEADRNGHEPQPGLALLRLAEGRVDAAAAAIRGVADPTADPTGGRPGGRPGPGLPRPRLLGAYVEIAIAAGDLVAAREAAEELTRIANAFDAPFLLATSTQATGAVLHAEGRMKASVALLREAWAIWRQLDMPYECARVRVLIGRGCRQLGDRDTARMHFDAARSAFRRLGAAPELEGLERLIAHASAGPPGDLTTRELEVLSRVADGQTNRQIAAGLGISEHTVARHLSNIFDKLGVSSRTAAGAFAHRHNLV